MRAGRRGNGRGGRGRRVRARVSVWVAGMLLLGLVGEGAARAGGVDAPVARLRSGDAILARPGAIRLAEPLPGRHGAGRSLVRIDGPVTEARREALRAAGVVLVQYLNSNTWVARVDRVEAGALEGLGFVAGVGAYRPEWKMPASFAARRFSTPERRELLAQGRALLRVHMFADATRAEIQQAIDVIEGRPNGIVYRTTAVGENVVIGAEVDLGAVGALTALGGVQLIEHAPELTERNATARGVVQSGSSGDTPLHDNGLRGLGQVLGVCDSGLDEDHCAFTDPPGKLLAFNGTPNITNHGTHVSATAVGNDSGNLRGHAYEANLVFSLQPSFTYTDMTTLLELQASQTARVHTNSWGDDTTEEYTGLSRAIDAFMHDDEDQLVVFAVTNMATLKSPENAKNCLSVAASNDAPNIDGFCSGGTGLTGDQRLKPDVLAPGCNITSAQGFSDCNTQTMSGTSMAAPAVAGTAALMRQYFMEGFYPTGTPTPSDGFTPSGALLKACAVNGATGLSGIPDLPAQQGQFAGWGRILAGDVAFFSGDSRTLYVEDVRNSAGLETGSVVEYQFDVLGSSELLKATLCWTDAPPAPGSAIASVNDLDLEIIAPDATTYLGNNFSGGVSVPGGAPDSRNNVEQVHLAAPDAGIWTVRIAGTNVPDGPQGFALVVTGEVAAPPRPLTIEAAQPPELIAPGDTTVTFEVKIEENDDLLVAGSPMLHYRYAGAGWSATALIPQGGDLYEAQLPAASCGHTPEFYVSAEGVQSGVRTAPPGAPGGFFAAVVGMTSETILLEEGFDGGLPGDWTAERLWHVTSNCERLPTCGSAPWAYFGDDGICGYGTGLTEQGELVTPMIALPALGPGERHTLRYCSSMDNEDFLFYDLGIVKANGELLEEAPDTASAWETREVDLSAFAGQPVELAWEFDTRDQFVNSFGGWQVDDIQIVSTIVDCTDPCPGDVNGDGRVDVFDFGDLAPNFGASPNATRAEGDLDGDGNVDVFDFGVLAAAFGDVCTP